MPTIGTACLALAGAFCVATAARGEMAGVASEAVLKTGFTVTLKVDCDSVTSNELLYTVGPVRLALRMAGEDKALRQYDKAGGNYLSYPMPDGKCAVLEATIAEKAGRIGIPLGFLSKHGGVHDVVLQFSPVKWAIAVDGHVDEDFPIPACPVRWPQSAAEQTHSPRVRAAAFVTPARADALPAETCRAITRSIQYWTPDDHNRWVGDVAPGFFDGKLHVFYLIDRRHHQSGAGTGRHQFAHLVTEDLVNWMELPLAVPIAEAWQTCGTGTPFMKDGKLALAFGWHTTRYKEMAGKPLGGTYAVSDDGVHFKNSGVMISDAQNPSIYNLSDGRYELVTSYGGSIGIFHSTDLLDWKLFDAKLPFRGDCPSLFNWHGHRYLLQGFTNMAYSEDGAPGSFVNWTNEPDKLYDGLGVPMVTSWKDDRRLYIGWLNHLHGWGGWMVFREVVYYPDGHLGLKWVPELVPPTPPQTYHVKGGEKFELVYRPVKGGTALRFVVDPAAKTASFGDDVPGLKFGEARRGDNVRIGGVRGIDADYDVKIIVHYDAKSCATIFDAEIAGGRTLICRRAGRWSPGVEKAAEKTRSFKDECRFDVFRDREWVTGEGVVVRVLKDDLRPPCHQRFLLEDSRGNTLLIVNNIDDWPRLKGIAPGVAVAFKGEFIDNEKGGLVHWTHPDPTGRKSGGWLKIIDK